jgi:hypothetical protein
MPDATYHVVSREDGSWGVRKTGEERASRVFDRKSDAVTYARDVARRVHGELYIHGNDGRIRESTSYARDPYPPRDSDRKR